MEYVDFIDNFEKMETMKWNISINFIDKLEKMTIYIVNTFQELICQELLIPVALKQYKQKRIKKDLRKKLKPYSIT